MKNSDSLARVQWHRFLFFLKHRKELMVTTISSLWTLVDLALLAVRNEWSGMTWLSLVGPTITAVSLALFFKNIRQERLGVMVESVQFSGDPPIGARAITTKNRTWHMYDGCNSALRVSGCQNPFLFKGKLRLPDSAKLIASYVLSSEFSLAHNERKVKLISKPDELANPGRIVRLMQTDYYSYLCTAFASWKKYIVDTRPAYDGTSLFMTNGKYSEYFEVSSANILGISTLILSRDLRIVLQQQTQSNVDSKGAYVPSGSGSLDVQDFSSRSFGEALSNGALREASEELGFSLRKLPRHKVFILGFAVDASRGLVPDFHTLTVLDADYHEIKALFRYEDSDRRQVISDAPRLDLASEESIEESLNEVLLWARTKGSDVLEISLILLRDFLQDPTTSKRLKEFFLSRPRF